MYFCPQTVQNLMKCSIRLGLHWLPKHIPVSKMKRAAAMYTSSLEQWASNSALKYNFNRKCYVIVKCVNYACDSRRLLQNGRQATSLLIKLLHVFLLSIFFLSECSWIANLSIFLQLFFLRTSISNIVVANKCISYKGIHYHVYVVLN